MQNRRSMDWTSRPRGSKACRSCAPELPAASKTSTSQSSTPPKRANVRLQNRHASTARGTIPSVGAAWHGDRCASRRTQASQEPRRSRPECGSDRSYHGSRACLAPSRGSLVASAQTTTPAMEPRSTRIREPKSRLSPNALSCRGDLTQCVCQSFEVKSLLADAQVVVK
jgi:hypothetical protein